MMKKTLCLLLAAILAAGTLVSCAKNTESAETESSASATETQSVGTEEVTTEALEVPDTRYDGTEVTFLTRDEGSWSTVEVFAEKPDSQSDNISTAVYERNELIREHFGITIKEVTAPCITHTARITKEVQGAAGDFSAIATNTVTGNNAGRNGYLWNLYDEEIQYINLDKPWWDRNLARGISLHDHLYFATGDIMTLDNDATFIILFNKEIVNETGVPDLYELASNGQWTMDRMAEFEAMALSDNGDSTLKYDEDRYGLAHTHDTPNALFYAGCLTIMEKDDSGEPVFTLDVERAQDIAEKAKLIFNKQYAVNMTKISPDLEEMGHTCFGGGHALFLSEVLQSVERMRGYEVEFGILPHPKFDEKQETYGNMMHITGSVVCIPRSVTADSKISLPLIDTLLEAMAYYSQDTLTEQYYEVNLKTKNSKDEQSGPMIDMILANRIFDMAYYYDFGGAVNKVSDCFDPDSKNQVASQTKSIKRYCEKMVGRLASSFDKNDSKR